MLRVRIGLLCAILIITILACGCQKAEQTLVPGAAKLTVDPSATYALLAVKADGSNYTTLAVAYDRLGELRWSPNGKLLAWCGLAWGNWDLYTVTADGLIKKTLSDDPAIDADPSWSPDSKVILNVAGLDKTHTKGEVLLTDYVQGSHSQVAKDDLPHEAADWAQKGSKLPAFTTKKPEGWIIETCDAKGENRKQIAGPFAQLGRIAWSPDGSQLATVQGNQLVLVPASGGAPRPASVKDAVETTQPQWSPDGTMIALRTKAGYCVVKAADGAVAWTCLPAPGGGTDVSWAPDSKRIVFASAVPSDNAVFVADVTSKQQPVTLVASEGCLVDPAWSPDGKTIALAFAPAAYARPKTD